MKKYYIFLFLFFISCDPEFKNGELICDPRAIDSCPSGFICLKDPKDYDTDHTNDFKCYNKLEFNGYCGDGKIQPDYEDCDPELQSESTCKAFDFHDNKTNPTKVYCEKCYWDLSPCQSMGKCGDGIIQPEIEDCEQGVLIDQYCMNELTDKRGLLLCNDECKYDQGYCYDNLQNQVDILMVLDGNSDFDSFREMFKMGLIPFFNNLKDYSGSNLYDSPLMIDQGFMDIHVGVVSSELSITIDGTPDPMISECTQVADNDGLFKKLSGDCIPLSGVNYLVNVAPRNGDIFFDGINCTVNATDLLDCDIPGEPPNLKLMWDAETGCPRCVNFDETTNFTKTISCMVDSVKSTGSCPIKQPLKAMEKSLTSDATSNSGFVRSGALQLVIFMSGSDDRSADKFDFLNDIFIFINRDELETEFYRQDLACDETWDTLNGYDNSVLHNCHSDKDNSVFIPIEHYIDNVIDLKDGNIVALGITGEFSGNLEFSQDMIFGDNNGNNGINPDFNLVINRTSTCNENIFPGIRLNAFIKRFSVGTVMEGSYPMCLNNYNEAFNYLYGEFDEIFTGDENQSRAEPN